DTKLKRDVAIKVLPEEFSSDEDRVNRFQREAEALASLNHPNIAAIYDLQESGGIKYLVLELVEGETLADQFTRRKRIFWISPPRQVRQATRRGNSAAPWKSRRSLAAEAWARCIARAIRN